MTRITVDKNQSLNQNTTRRVKITIRISAKNQNKIRIVKIKIS